MVMKKIITAIQKGIMVKSSKLMIFVTFIIKFNEKIHHNDNILGNVFIKLSSI